MSQQDSGPTTVIQADPTKGIEEALLLVCTPYTHVHETRRSLVLLDQLLNGGPGINHEHAVSAEHGWPSSSQAPSPSPSSSHPHPHPHHHRSASGSRDGRHDLAAQSIATLARHLRPSPLPPQERKLMKAIRQPIPQTLTPPQILNPASRPTQRPRAWSAGPLGEASVWILDLALDDLGLGALGL